MLGWQDNLLVLGATIVSAPLLLGKKYAGDSGIGWHRWEGAPLIQPAILTALPNFQQQ